MKRLLFLVLALFLWNGNSWGQSAIIGTGTSTTNGSSADPIERYFNYEHFQIVYTATELTAAGMPPNVTITGMGFSVSESAASLANFSVDLGHTTQATADPYISTGLTNVVSAFTYTPVVQTAGNFDMISFTSNFAWDGSSNIVVNTCTGSNPYTTPYGGLRYTSSTSGSMRYIRTDGGSGNCETATNTSSSNKPNVRFDYVSTLPALFASPPTLDFGFVSSGSTSAEQIYTLSGVNLTAGPIVVTAPAGFGVSLTTGGPYISSVNVTYTPPTLASTTIYVQFSPTAPNTNYTGIITNIGGGSKASADVAVSGASPQDPASVPYSTDFEEPLGMSDWTLVNGTEINAWYIGVATAYSPSQSVYVSNDNGTNNAYSINSSSVVHFYRDIDFPAGTNPVDLEFYWKGYGESIYDYLRVYLVELDDFPEAGTLLTSGQIGSTYYNQQNDWIVENITLDPLVNGTSKRLVFSWRNDGSGGTTPPAAIDDVGLSTISCPEPTTLPETNITLNSADLSWTETGTATTWLYEYGISPYTFTGIGTSITSTTVTISGLNPDETYDWAVQADCDGGSFSNWVYTGQFTTHDGKAANPVPANGALNLLITSKTFDWDDVPGADSYIIDIGTETGLADIISGDACPTSTYTYTGSDWDYFEDYFWTVTTVYTAKAEIIGDEWDFTTECFPLSAPFSEFFDGVTAPDMPDCWSRIVNSTSTNAYVNTSTFNVPVSSPYHIVMSNFEDADADLLLVSPRLGDLNTQLNRIRFWAMGGDYYMLIGTMSDPTDESTFTHFETVLLPIFYEEFAVEFDASYTGSDEFIAFKHAQGEINKSTFIDNFHYEPIPTGPPPCASPISPWDGEPEVPVDGTLEWSSVFDATGYKIYFGTDGGGTSDPTNIANEVDLGDVTSYTYSGLAFSTVHYWKIVPYNANGYQTACDIWSFTTIEIPPEGDNCYNPLAISLPSTLPYSDIGQTTCGRLNDYDVTCFGYYDNGEDIIYEINVTSDVGVTFLLDPKGTSYSGIVLFDICPGAGTPICLGQSTTGSSSSVHGFSYSLIAGTYYLMIDTWSTPDCIPDFDLTITEAESIDWCNLQWPDVATILTTENETIFAQCWEEGVTNADPNAPGVGIECWIGYSDTDTDPAGWTDWVVATYNQDDGNNDEFMADLGLAQGLAPGTYYYASRFRYLGGTFTYGGYPNGAWNGTTQYSGILTVNAAPGYTCDNPLVISSLPYLTTDNTSNYGDDYNYTDEVCSGSNYLNGDDVVYSYTPVGNECIDITLTNTDTWVGLFVYEGCAPFTTCVGSDTQISGDPSLSGLSLTGGMTYYILISTNPSPQSTPYDMEIAICPACPAPTNQTETNITSVGADLGWDFAVDSFFDIFIEIDLPPEPPTPPTAGTPPTISGVPGNSVTWDGGFPNTTYNWWVRTNCGFTENAKVDYFWMAMPEPLMLEPGLSGGSSELIDPGEDFVWREYFDPNTGFAWWNIWFYNDPYIEENVKLIRMGFWIQTIDAGFDGNLAYVVNWSNGLWTIPEQYPMPPDEFAIERSPLNGNFVIPSGAPQWFELTYLIEDYNPEWVSVDIAGDNIQILEFSLDPPPADSPLFKWWQPGSPGGIIVHECLPANLGDNNSEWTGPGNFTTLALPPANDLCANAEVVSCGNTYPGTTTAATWDDVGECGTTNTQPGVWYVFTGPGGMVSADLCNGTTTWDSKISVFEGSCGALVCVDGNDDYCNYQSRLDWYAENGVDYYILVHQFGTSGGAFDLTIDCTDPATAIWQGDDYPDYYDWFGADNWDVQDVPGAGTNVSIPAGLTYYPTIDREARCNNLTIGSDASGTATILDNAYLAMYGTGTVDLYFTGDPTGAQDWHLVSSPITTAQAGVFMGMYLQSFDNTTYTYTDIEDELYPLDVMTGYGLYSMLSVDNTVTFTGNINFGVEGQAISPGADAFNWNLLGNPYPSGIDWEAVTIPVNMTNEVHYIEAATGNDLSYVQGTGGTGSQYIPPMQGFFVSATGVDNLIFNDAARSHDGGGIYYKDANPLLVVLEAAGENFTDETWIHFNENAGEEHDGQFDAYKRISLSNPELPQLFSYTPGGIMLSVNGMPNVESVAVGFTAVESGVFTINAIETGEFSELYLEDVFNNNKIDLLTSGYTFTYTEGDQQNRFILHFALTGVNDNLAGNINIFSYEKDVYVTIPEFTTGDIKIYNIMGQEIVSTSINNTLNKIRLQESAYYVVVVLSNKTVVTEKVFIK